MHHFTYRDGALFAEEVDLARIAEEVGTPFYCYSTATIERHFRVFSAAFADASALGWYAMKANCNQAVLATPARKAKCAARGPPASPATRSFFRGSARPGPRWLWRSTKASCASTSSPSR